MSAGTKIATTLVADELVEDRLVFEQDARRRLVKPVEEPPNSVAVMFSRGWSTADIANSRLQSISAPPRWSTLTRSSPRSSAGFLARVVGPSAGR